MPVDHNKRVTPHNVVFGASLADFRSKLTDLSLGRWGWGEGLQVVHQCHILISIELATLLHDDSKEGNRGCGPTWRSTMWSNTHILSG